MGCRQRKSSLGSVCLLLTAVLVSLPLVSCSSTPSNPATSPLTGGAIITPVDHPVLPSRGFFMGILATPAQGESFADAYKEASTLAEFAPVWGRPTPFYQLAQELSGSWGHTFVEQYIRGNGMFPIVNLSFIGANMTLVAPPGMQEASLDDPEWRKAYMQAALDVVKAARPRYLSLGNEVNRWYERYGARDGDPNGFQNYVSLYNEIYDAVKKLSPQTVVFCTFAREIVSENREADLSVLEMFDADKLDMLVFTSYPYAVKGIKRPEDIPNNYYARALNYMPGKPFGLSEVGWAALDALGGEQGQADFIREVTGRLTIGQGINVQLLGWPWLSALDENDPIALVKRDGTQRLAYGVWLSLFSNLK
jgi:hypothetical protein